MSDTLIALECALEILRLTRYNIKNAYAWRISYHATQALEKQIADYFKEEQK